MNAISRTITGLLIMILGLSLMTLFFFRGFWPFIIYGLPLFIIGLFIFFNKKEDEIEKIKEKQEEL
jgi:membrane-bound ClpP family serine protease